MTKPFSKGPDSRAALGRPLLVLTILAALLTCALIAMSVYLFDADVSVELDNVSILVFEINKLDILSPQIVER